MKSIKDYLILSALLLLALLILPWFMFALCDYVEYVEKLWNVPDYTMVLK